MGAFSLCHVRTQWERRWPSASQEERSHQIPTLLAPWSQSSQNYEKCLLAKPLSLWYFVKAARQTKTSTVTLTNIPYTKTLVGCELTPVNQIHFLTDSHYHMKWMILLVWLVIGQQQFLTSWHWVSPSSLPLPFFSHSFILKCFHSQCCSEKNLL